MISDVPEDGIDLLLVRLGLGINRGQKRVAKILQRTQESMLETNSKINSCFLISVPTTFPIGQH